MHSSSKSSVSYSSRFRLWPLSARHVHLTTKSLLLLTKKDKTVAQTALLQGMQIYSPTERLASCNIILRATHSLLQESLRLCTSGQVASRGAIWTCFLINNMPMVGTSTVASRV